MHPLYTLSSPDLDQYFGLNIHAIERALLKEALLLRPQGNLDNLGHALHEGNQTWIGLDPEVLNTPYSELVQVCSLLALSPKDHVVDLGAGYGRLGLVLSCLHPDVRFSGYELVQERVDEGNRVFSVRGHLLSRLFSQDLTDAHFQIPEADVYFLYDYGKVSHIRETLKQLERYADKKSFKVVARGKGSRSIIDLEHPWLSQINPVLREENFAIYSY